MDAIELLGQLGQVEPAEQEVLDAALRRLALAARRDSGRARRRHQLVTVAAAAAVTLAAAGTAAVVAGLGPARSPRPAGAHQPRRVHPGRTPVTASGPPRGSSPRVPTVAAILTAFRASGGDILRVTKTVRDSGESTLRTVIWVWPAGGKADGGTVRSRILTIVAGTRLNDVGLTYPASAPSPPEGCAIFSRPRIAYPPAAGEPGSMTVVTYSPRSWGRAVVTVQAANLPSAARLRACLTAGQWQIAGRGDIAGTRVTELTAGGGDLRLWVSTATDLPVRLRSGGRPDLPDITFTFAFLAPTRASLAMLTPPVPAGFPKRPL